jgi:hypothetical protein
MSHFEGISGWLPNFFMIEKYFVDVKNFIESFDLRTAKNPENS